MPRLALAFLLTVCAAIPGEATACDDPQEIPRTIIALYDGHRETSPRATRIHRYAEMPLNYLGYRILYADVSDGPAPLPDLPLAATISWFDAPVAAPEALAAWRAGLADSCGHVPAPIVFGHTGLSDSVSRAESGRAYLTGVGLIREEGDIAVGAFSEIQVRDATIVGAETALDIRPGPYSTIRAADSATSRLSLTSGDARTDLLVLAPAAAYVHDSALVRYDPRGGALWVSDPFALFGHALGSSTWPVPDTTTLSGRRMFFVTVDADGWLTPLPARQFGDRPPLSAEVLDSEIITPYPDTPMSVALLVGDLDPQIGGPVAARGQQVAGHIMQLPHVQPATSGVSMIRDWSFFAAYDRQAEEATLTSGAARRNSGAIVAFAVQNLENAFVDAAASALDITPNAPRKYASVAFDLVAETAGAIETIAALAPPGAEPPLFSWSGNAMALPGAVAAVTEKGSSNMGGGGGFATLTAPSLTNLWPLGVETEGGLQVYDALSGDSHYTAFWTGNLSGFQALAQTLARTETPRRLKPFHLSFAARSATHFATRMAVIDNLEQARAADVAPVPAARYAAAVAGFTRYRAIREGDLAWRIEDRGALNTVRFDNAQSLSLDAASSDGVLGARRHAEQLYVALDPSFSNPLVTLAETDAPSGIVAAGPEASLVDVRAEILAVAHEDCTLRTTMRGYGEAESTWIGTPGASYELTLYEQDGATRRYWEQIVADDDGFIVANLPLPPGLASPVSIATPCSGG